MKTFFKKFVCFLISVTIILGALSSCGNDEGSQLISFSQSQTLSSLKELDGKEVSIIGYMAKSSPPTGQYMYLMNLPYQTCPFCGQDTVVEVVYGKPDKKLLERENSIEPKGRVIQ